MRVDELLRTAAGRGLTLVAGPWDARGVESIIVVDAADGLSECPRGAVAVLTRAASVDASGPSLEAALRRGGEQQVAALAVYGPPTTSVGAIAAASSARVALLAVPRDVELGELAQDLQRALRADADAAIRRLLATVAVLEYAERSGVEAVLSAASQALGTWVGFDAGPGTGVPVIVAGVREGFVHAHGNDPETVIACRIVADAVARVRGAERRSERERMRSRAQLLGELARARGEEAERLADRARALDLDVDGDHAAIALIAANAQELAGDPIAAADLLDEIVRAAAHAANAADPPWYARRDGKDVLLLRVRSGGAGSPGARDAAAAARAVVTHLTGRHAGLRIHCGASGMHTGVAGLRTAADEAGRALGAAVAGGRTNVVVHGEGTGLDRLLLDWSGSPGGHAVLGALLAPLERLGPRRTEAAVRTLQVYLDERGSLKRSGAALHLHPNAVAYRIRRIVASLGADLDDPEQRLSLQLACRAWALAHPPATSRAAR
jgi:sugar diacid utilization regulator